MIATLFGRVRSLLESRRFLARGSLIVLGVSLLSAAALAQIDITQGINSHITGAVSSNIATDFFRPTFDVQHLSGGILGINLDGSERMLTVLAEPGEAAIWNVKTGIQVARIHTQDAEFAGSNSSGTVTVVLSKSGTATAYAADGTAIAQSRLAGSAVGVMFAADGTAYLATTGALSAYDPVQHGFVPLPAVPGGISAIGFGGKLGDAVISSVSGNVIAVSAARTFTPAGSLKSPAIQISGCADQPSVLAVSADGTVSMVNATANTVMGKLDGQVVALDRACRFAAAGADSGGMTLLDRNGQARSSLQPTIKLGIEDGPITGIALDSGASRLISGEKSGIVRIWDLAHQRDVLQIYLTQAGWVVIDQNGRFDGSEEGMLDVGWLAKSQRVTLDQFADKYFEPGLLASELSPGGGQPARLASVQNGMYLPPKIDVQVQKNPATGQQTMVIAVAQDQGGGAGPVRLYHNGKLVPAGAQLQQQEQTVGGKQVLAVAFNIAPTAGLNTLVATSSTTKAAPDGSDFSVLGKSDEVDQTYDSGSADSTLYVLSVGINAYRDPKNALDYAVPDAQAIAALLQSQPGHHFQRVVPVMLTNGQASLQGIQGALKNLASTNPGDVVAIFLAGHGEVFNGDWNFIPADGNFQSSQLTASSLRDSLAAIPAQRILLMIDSCESGQSAAVFNQHLVFQARYLRDLSRADGVTVLAGTRADQEAYELPVLGHGLFTAGLLASLQGGSPSGGAITAHHVARDVGTEMHLLVQKQSQKFSNFDFQEPVAFALGADFVLR